MTSKAKHKDGDILWSRHVNGYEQRHVFMSGKPYKGPDVILKSAYTLDGLYLGDYRLARFLFMKKGITRAEKSDPDHCVCSIGWNAQKKKWFGWSHRAICGFGLGDKLFEEEFGNDCTPFVKHGRKTIRSFKQAKQAAAAFANSVS